MAWQSNPEGEGFPEIFVVSNVVENTNPKGATVTADVKFTGKKTIPVRYVLTYRGERVVTEIWQIDPKLGQY